MDVHGDRIPKFAIYFEPDVSEDNNEPSDEMVRYVANILKEKYEETRRDYPTMDMNGFIKSLDCEHIGENFMHNKFTETLNYSMRPIQLQKAINIILGL